MWEKIKMLNEKRKNKYFKAIIFFSFYFIFFLAIILLSSINNNVNENNNKNKNNGPEIKDKWEVINNNFEYLYQIKIKDENNNDLNITLEGKKYKNKNLFTKHINDELYGMIYIYYDEVKIKKENDWEKVEYFDLVYPDFNENLIDISYLKTIIKEASLINKETNFDESIIENYKYLINENEEINISVLTKNNLITTITITGSDYELILQYKNINKVEDVIV